MSEVKRFRADHRHVVETEFDDAQYVGVADFDRVAAERDALQQRLNAQDQRVDNFVRAARELLSNAINADGAGEMVVQRIDIDDLRNLLNPTPKPTCYGWRF
jgi:hypothetical protein